MNNCPNCGSTVNQGEAFCRMCGTKLPLPQNNIFNNNTQQPEQFVNQPQQMNNQNVNFEQSYQNFNQTQKNNYNVNLDKYQYKYNKNFFVNNRFKDLIYKRRIFCD